MTVHPLHLHRTARGVALYLVSPPLSASRQPEELHVLPLTEKVSEEKAGSTPCLLYAHDRVRHTPGGCSCGGVAALWVRVFL